MQSSTIGTHITLLGCPATAELVHTPIDPSLMQRWASWLTSDEKSRFANYRRREDQQLFVARHGLARECLANQLSLTPESIRLVSLPSGKLGWNAHDLGYEQTLIDFSVSRATGVAAAAVCKTYLVGIDVERICLLPEIKTLATQNLHPVELKYWQQLPEATRLHAYYRLWVVKEAYAKALGVGLTLPPCDILANEAMNNNRGIVRSDMYSAPTNEAEFWLTRVSTDKVLAVVVLKR
ncbi:MAG: 4'-phosphopantetheinyl transferase superfamily protein [Planctomycetota bacterium]|nr:4'-phosphopantetheinyl transferase superfamily protein [Planctomycetota bacterium]